MFDNLMSDPPLTLTASSGDELEMSIDGINYYNQLPLQLLLGLFEDIKLYDVTTMDGRNFYTGGLREEMPAVPNEYYLSFELWFRTTRKEEGIYLINNVSKEMNFDDQMNGTYVVSKGVTWTAKHGFFNGPTLDDWVERGTTNIYYADQAIRIGTEELIDQTNIKDTRNSDELKVFIYDPSENEYRGYGTTYGAFSYFMQASNAWIYIPIAKPDTSYRLSSTDPFDPYRATDNESLVAILQQSEHVDDNENMYYQAKIRVNIWVEGWDADAFDALDQDLVKIQLQFRALNLAQD
ncbi:MAG: hypothetical protein CVV61_08560 [Tenericutes bacterium HGW-Tenericutes-6]|nr:MAG: hypothetical protein CVV61_08560 [Tenericutes bacterium HGW-Tenericutes-6]